MLKTLSYVFFLCTISLNAQDYDSFLTGDANDVTTNHLPGYCLMGGATENDEAMKWFLQKAAGGDVLVLRASGSDGYNSYFYNELGVTVNSVETILLNNSAAASNPYVISQVQNAEAIWFAGGDQWDYVSYIKNSPLMGALNEFINTKKGTIGGTSAGMAIMGGIYFEAEFGTVTSSEALSNPLSDEVSLGFQDFLEVPFLQNVITDTHFDDPDRRGRLTAFMAVAQENLTSNEVMGIACDEYTSVCIEEDGTTRVFGDYPEYDDFAYFVKINCVENNFPSILESGSPLTWNTDEASLKAFKIGGTFAGIEAVNLNTLNFEDEHGEWINWSVINGNFNFFEGEAYECDNLKLNKFEAITTVLYPNPVSNILNLRSIANLKNATIYNLNGKLKLKKNFSNQEKLQLSLENFSNGIYFVELLLNDGKKEFFKIIKE